MACRIFMDGPFELLNSPHSKTQIPCSQSSGNHENNRRYPIMQRNGAADAHAARRKPKQTQHDASGGVHLFRQRQIALVAFAFAVALVHFDNLQQFPSGITGRVSNRWR